MTKITVIPEQDGCWAIISINSLKASRANDTLFSRAFHTTSRYDFRAYDIRPFRKLNVDPSPRPQGVGTQKIVPVHVPFMYVTHTQNLVEFWKNKITPKPPRYRQVPPLGMTQAAE